MTPGARVQGAIDLLDDIIAAARGNGAPADRVASEWFKSRRYAGSGDRRAIRDLAWRAIRSCGDTPATGRAALLRVADADPALRELFDGQGHAPAPIQPGEPVAKAGFAPKWLYQALQASDVTDDDMAAMLERAPLDLRANTLKTSREELIAALPELGEATVAPLAIRYPHGTPADRWPQFEQGLFEVQDAGSQLACAALDVRPGETVVDLCAGAGGKTLALGAAMDNTGRLIAADTDRGRLSRLPQRAARAGVAVESVLLNPDRELEALADLMGKADAVLIDAPCSGTGTWRRNPETRWRLTSGALERYATLQSHLLDVAAVLVKPGGRMTYVVCSLLDREGPDQAAAFLARNPGWVARELHSAHGQPRGSGCRLTPRHDGTDGFFFTTLERL